MLLLLRVISSRFLVLLLLQTALFTAMFMFLPNRRKQVSPSLPGAPGLPWGGSCFLTFPLYVEHFSNFSTVYGSLSAVAIAMLWLYTCVAIVFLRRRPQQISGRHRLPAPPAAVGERAGAGMLKKGFHLVVKN